MLFSMRILQYYKKVYIQILINTSGSKAMLSAKPPTIIDGKGKILHIENMNPNIIKLQYTVRPPIEVKMMEIEKQMLLNRGPKRSFNEITYAHLGDGQAFGQIPISFIRQVLALVTYPALINNKLFKEDVVERARALLRACRGNSVGSYTDSRGIELIRQHVAVYIKKRDERVKSNWKDIILNGGASGGIKTCFNLFMNHTASRPAGCLIPVPQYPLYCALLAEFNIKQINYYLNESKNWSIDINELRRAYKHHMDCIPRILVVINPGNPTGNVLTVENMQDIIKFAYRKQLFIFADEVFQTHVHSTKIKFNSFKKVMYQMGEPYRDMELVSFMSVSKGFYGECGIRGGYTEMINICPEVQGMYKKLISSMLSPPTLGQIALDCVVDPPINGDPSYDLFKKEKEVIANQFKEGAKIAKDAFNSMVGVSCNEIEGATFAFPSIKIPPKAIEAAKAEQKEPDSLYCDELLETTGICIIPGSDLGQNEGTYHIRVSILPQRDHFQEMLKKIANFHKQFLIKYN